MKKLDTLLKRWQEAGLMTAIQADGIRQFEDSRGKSKWGYSFYALGAFSVLLGIVAVVAANWWNIPSELKLGLHIAVNSGLAWFIWRNLQQGRRTLNEYLIYALAVLTLTLIALIGQTFQMGGDFTDALRLWSVLVAPMLWFFGDTARQGRVFGLLWPLMGALWIPHLVEYLDNNTGGRIIYASAWLWLLMVSLVLPKLAMSASFGEALKREMIALFLITGSLYTLIPYTSQRDMVLMNYDFMIMTNLVVAGLGFFLLKKEKNTLNGIILLTALVGIAALLSPYDESGLYSATIFILYWFAVACLGHELNEGRIFMTAIWLIALRLFIAYIEVFGNLARTGAGLIVTGLIFIGMAYLTRNIQKRFAIKGGRA